MSAQVKQTQDNLTCVYKCHLCTSSPNLPIFPLSFWKSVEEVRLVESSGVSVGADGVAATRHLILAVLLFLFRCSASSSGLAALLAKPRSNHLHPLWALRGHPVTPHRPHTAKQWNRMENYICTSLCHVLWSHLKCENRNLKSFLTLHKKSCKLCRWKEESATVAAFLSCISSFIYPLLSGTHK